MSNAVPAVQPPIRMKHGSTNAKENCAPMSAGLKRSPARSPPPPALVRSPSQSRGPQLLLSPTKVSSPLYAGSINKLGHAHARPSQPSDCEAQCRKLRAQLDLAADELKQSQWKNTDLQQQAEIKNRKISELEQRIQELVSERREALQRDAEVTPAPAELCPVAFADFAYEPGVISSTIGQQVVIQPMSTVGSALPISKTFTIEPPLPEGMSLCRQTGNIEGAAINVCREITYHVTATITAPVTLEVVDSMEQDEEPSMEINEDFAALVVNVTNLAEMPQEPKRFRACGDWMVWMVHRAWLNDPTLEDLDFTGMDMPDPNEVPMIAPKLVQAIENNTHIKTLSLSNSNLQKMQAMDLAKSLRSNCTLTTLNLESNCLDPISVREIALAIKESGDKSRIEHLRLSHQRQMGPSFGRRAEEAVRDMMHQNERIVKLGFECEDRNSRNIIDRALVRNNDLRRRQLQAASEDAEDSQPTVQEMTLAQVSLNEPPVAAADGLTAEEKESAVYTVLCAYVAMNKKLPTVPQLQSFAKNNPEHGVPTLSLPYATAAPLIRKCRSCMLDAAIGSEVSIVDAFGTHVDGFLKAWSESNENWSVDVCAGDGRRLAFRSKAREPTVSVSEAWAHWLPCGSALSKEN